MRQLNEDAVEYDACQLLRDALLPRLMGGEVEI